MRIPAVKAVLLIGGLSTVVHPAWAQEDGPPEATTETPATAEPAQLPAPVHDPDALPEIVVTAQKRKESLQDAPISISAFSAEKLEQRGIDGLDDLTGHVPSMTVEPFPTNHTTLRIFIRGLGISDTQITQDPPVGVYMDGVYIARATGLALDIADLERIEVLRGPQGTLYGRNTTGGAINLITRRPSTDAFSMVHKLVPGNRSSLVAKSTFNIPVTDTLAFKVAALKTQRDGFVENTGPGGDFGDSDQQGLRLDARWHPLDWLIADYTYDYSDLEHFNYMYQAVLRPNADHGQAELFKPFAVGNTVYSRDRLDELSSGPPYEPSTSEIEGHALTFTGELDGGHELKYIVANRKLTDATYADLGGGLGSLDYRLDSHVYDGPAAFEAIGRPTPLVIPELTHDQWSHELQLTGKLFDGTVEYVAGAFYFSEDAIEDRHTLNHQVSTAISPDQLDELSGEFPELDPVIAPVLGLLGLGNLNQVDQVRLVNFVDLNFEIENKAKAVYVQGTWTPPKFLDEKLHLTLGYRHSEDERKAVKFRISDNYVELREGPLEFARLLSSGEFFNNIPASNEFNDDSYTFIAAYDLTPDVNIYFKSAEAYKSGGFNVRDPQISGASGPASDGQNYGFGFVEGFAPEQVESLEIGIKSEWLDRRLRLNADIFQSDITDMQINFLIPGTISDTKTRNAGEAEMKGFELDASWLARPGLVFSAEYAYLDAEVLEVIDINGNNVAHLFPFTSAPPNSFSGAVDWTFLKRDWGNLRATLAYNYIDERDGLVIVEERRGLTALPAYDVINARIGADTIAMGRDGFLDVGLWVKNMADEEYPVVAIDNLPHADRAVVWGEPRSYGMDLIYRWN